mmetsp:Transcript_39681/g.66593  ORF Transcript_39681/g.66593 Transcript_39681/m.66593 type:complete len:445 (+) Transcript_39681:802-2136(+)
MDSQRYTWLLLMGIRKQSRFWLGREATFSHRTQLGTLRYIGLLALGEVETVRLLVKLGGDVLAQDAYGLTPLDWAADRKQLETLRVLVELGDVVYARAADGITPLYEHDAVVSTPKKNARSKRRPTSTTPVVDPAWPRATGFPQQPVAVISTVDHPVGSHSLDPAAQATAEVAMAMAIIILIIIMITKLLAALWVAAEDGDLKRAPPSKQGSSNKARKHSIDTNMASSSGRRDNVGERDNTGRNAARHIKPDGHMDAHGGEKRASHVATDNEGKSHKQQLERERKGKQRQRKRATAHASLEEALTRVETSLASLDNLNALDAAIVSAKRILEHGSASSSTDELVVSSCASSGLLELLRQAEEKWSHLSREVLRAMRRAAESGNTSRAGDSVRPDLCGICMDDDCVINTAFIPCGHRVACSQCARKLELCPICRARVESILKTFD